MNDLILETKGVKKYFGKQTAVNDVSIHIKRNSIYGLLGPNGAGKSTILKMITGLLYPSEGEIIVFDEPWKREALGEMGALIESPALYSA